MKAEYIDHMGDDLRVANAARVSFDKESDWEEVEVVEEYIEGWPRTAKEFRLSERDAKLVGYLAAHNHFTPFTHCVVTLRETVPIFVARQRFKHTVGFTYNEVSRRYVDAEPEFFVPDAWRKKAENKKQGSSEETVTVMTTSDYIPNFGPDYYEATIASVYRNFCDKAFEIYDGMIAAGVCPEQARMVLPQSMYTSYYVTGSLSAFARAYKLRSDSHAQKEIQDLATEWDTIIRPLFPVSWAALVD